jgi:hypothetical protein
MDIVSHALLGRVLVTSRDRKPDIYLVTLFGALPDLFQFPLYLFVGYLHQRPFFYPLTSDWTGIREAYPLWSALWEIPHSFLFVLLVVAPLVLYFKGNKLLIAAYALHLFVDLFTHSGEWAMKPLYPLPFMVHGFTDAWAWNAYWYPVSWALLIGAIVLIERYRLRSKRS